MNAKLIVAVCGVLIAAPVFAGQQFGRDSVYGSPGATLSVPVTNSATARSGRDSVYAAPSAGPSKTQRVESGPIGLRAGRA
jgi:hypothetical protein